jgi:protein O-mannosyl-transferase
LEVFYPYPNAFPAFLALSAAGLLLGVTAAAVALRRRQPYLLVGWLWFLGTLVPVIGLVQVGAQAMADRYTYLPSLGIFVMLVWGVHSLAARRRRPALVLGAAATAAVLACVLITSRQIGYWKSNETLYRHALAVTKDNWLAHFNLAYALSKDPNRRTEAIAEYEDTLRLAPRYAKAYYNLGNVEASAGRPADAAASFRGALRIQPDYPEALNELGDALMQVGRVSEAAGEYRAALKLQPGYLQARDSLAIALTQSGQWEQAVEEFRAESRLLPGSAEIRNNLGCALVQLGRTAEARREFEEALRLKPDDAEARLNLARLDSMPQ